MGGGSSQPLSLTEQYVKMGYLMPSTTEYDNEFEKQLFFAINILRANPASFVPYIKEAKNHPRLKDVQKSDIKDL